MEQLLEPFPATFVLYYSLFDEAKFFDFSADILLPLKANPQVKVKFIEQ